MRESMAIYPITAMERAMKLQEVFADELTRRRSSGGRQRSWSASARAADATLAEAVEDEGPQGLLDRRRRKPSSRRVAKKQA